MIDGLIGYDQTVRWWGIACRSQRSIQAENLFLRRQLALYIERGVKPRRIDSVTRVTLALPGQPSIPHFSYVVHLARAPVKMKPDANP